MECEPCDCLVYDLHYTCFRKQSLILWFIDCISRNLVKMDSFLKRSSEAKSLSYSFSCDFRNCNTLHKLNNNFLKDQKHLISALKTVKGNC